MRRRREWRATGRSPVAVVLALCGFATLYVVLALVPVAFLAVTVLWFLQLM